MNFKRLIVAAVGLSMGLAGVHGGALAQMPGAPTVSGNVAGNCVTSPAANTAGANAGDWTITCGDITPGAGLTVIGPPSVASDPVPVVAPEPMAPATDPAPVAAPAPETAVTDTAVATATDLDADNLADALEWDLGLDPNTPDSDVDGVADGDEINIYGTSPTLFDTDGDGASDGEELFGIFTNPLVWDDFAASSGDDLAAQGTAAEGQTGE